jgi:hypothetical protein
VSATDSGFGQWRFYIIEESSLDSDFKIT